MVHTPVLIPNPLDQIKRMCRGAIERYLTADQIEDPIWNVYYCGVLLGRLDAYVILGSNHVKKLTQPEV